MLKYHHFWGTSPADFSTAGDASPRTPAFDAHVSRTYSIRLTANRRAQIDSGNPGLSFCYLTIVLGSIVIEIIATFYKNSLILRKFDLFYPL